MRSPNQRKQKMADFDTFEEDPAADFLAREKEDLGELVDETLGSGQNVTGVIPSTGEGMTEDIFGMTEEPVSNNPYSVISQMDETPECILKWREDQTKILQGKDEEESKALQELRDAASKELDDWYNHHEDTLKHAKDSNRQAEEAFIEERDEDIPGHEWERVARICDFNPKSNKNAKDVSRMRSMFLQLKQTPPVH